MKISIANKIDAANYVNKFGYKICGYGGLVKKDLLTKFKVSGANLESDFL